jgi:hypothetical protein
MVSIQLLDDLLTLDRRHESTTVRRRSNNFNNTFLAFTNARAKPILHPNYTNFHQARPILSPGSRTSINLYAISVSLALGLPMRLLKRLALQQVTHVCLRNAVAVATDL